ncbi:MAG TPA: HEAT repeat domain-containing protein [Planctomycetota bacterium]|nr:HEAT repeat domain-containing protein [Planctomycetota bacterium]
MTASSSPQPVSSDPASPPGASAAASDLPSAAPTPPPADPHDGDPEFTPAQAKKRARSLLIIRLVALAMVVVPLIFWLMTSFLVRLDDDKLQAYLEIAVATPPDSPDAGKAARNAQHALTEISTRLGDHDPNVNKFFPLLAKLADHPEPAVRRTAAWVMGDAPGSEILHAALVKLVSDPDPLVRYNAAPALSKYHDGDHARPVLAAMLKPFALTAPAAGKIQLIVAKDSGLREAMQAVVLDLPDGKQQIVPAPLEGRVMDLQAHEGDTVAAGQGLMLIQANPNQVFNALVALMLVGEPDDLALIRPFTLAGNGDMIREQAQNAIDAINLRHQAH